MGEKVSVYASVHRTVSYQLLDHHPLEGDTETPTDGRHGTSVSLSRRVMTHHLSARTDRFFVCGVCVCIYLDRTTRGHTYSTIDIAHRRTALSHARVVHPPPRWKDDGDGDDTRRRERRRREGAETREDERTVSIESARACADRIDRIERIERIERIHRIHRSDG